MFIVTGGAGFIGSNIIKALNSRGIRDILVVDNLTNGVKFKNIVSCDIADYLDKDVFVKQFSQNSSWTKKIKAVFHQGACSSTTEWDGRYMMENNYQYSKELLHLCLDEKIPFIYASSGAVYGHTTIFKENPEYENPLNVYGYSKLQFDRYVRSFHHAHSSPVVGLRYFNVFGPAEYHKGSMASVIFHFYNQLKATGTMNLFEGTDNYPNGEQQRDFVYVEDVVNVNLWFYDNPSHQGIFNVGTGQSRSFNDVAKAIIDYSGHGKINYIPFPAHLKGYYQSLTKADISLLRKTGYNKPFLSLEEGVKKYLALM